MAKTRKVQVFGSLQNSNPDWNQTDETKPDYIKNKPASGQIVTASIVDGVLVLEQAKNLIAKGEQGEAGPQGPKGDSYVLTEADKDEITADILAQLPLSGGYVVAEPVEVTLSAAQWNGTTYTLVMRGYTSVYEIQIGLPAVSSSTNTEQVVKSALTIPQTSSSTSSETGVTTVTIIISAVTAPSIDIDVALFGLVAQEVA